MARGNKKRVTDWLSNETLHTVYYMGASLEPYTVSRIPARWRA